MFSQQIILKFKFVSPVTFPYYHVAFFFPTDGRNPQIFLMNGFLCLLYFQIDKGLFCFFPVIISQSGIILLHCWACFYGAVS